ncbi:TDP1 protein [Loa loa]|uniref:TDP1 protein n=1 Tax=Loa loa TaxID=7209 RepID=A0A1I7W0R4_LOALO|nr:TDP1 protein [Loa loa]EJD75879.1 TDP1 protein [Loa loa]
MKRGMTKALACVAQECDDLESKGSEGKRMKQNCLMDKLYFNKVVGLAEQYNVNAFSFAELLELISPVASIHFNFMIDLRWLLTQYPGRLRQGPITLIVGERMGTDFTLTKTAVKQCGVNNVNVGRARLMIPFGTHHSKISIFESNTGRVHIIIATANLLESDWNFKTQAFFHCSGNELAAGDCPDRNGSDFQTDLVKYLDEYKTSQDWGLIEHWRDRVSNIDLSQVKARVVYSVPGTHKGVQLTKYGHPRLRVILKELFGDVKNMDGFTYHAQCSSLGSLGAAPQYWLTGQFLNSLSGGAETDGEHLRIIYPCVEDVRNSNEGYAAGGSFPYSNSVAVKQPYLLNFMHKWSSDHLGRSRAMPHIKTYAAFAKDSLKPSWLLITSANLSKAAWGDYQSKKPQLTIRSYEFGLLFSDPESLDMLPYDLPLTKYDDNDRVWIVDKTYRKPDIFRKTWPMAKSGKCVLSFGDTVLYEADLKALENGRWLSDPVISFAFEYLHTRILDETKRDKISFINAAVCQLIKLSTPDEVTELLDELTLKEKEHVIFVVNDHDDPSRSGGSHWSLLICRRDLQPHFLIIDSAQGTISANQKATDKLIQILAKYFGLPVDTRIERATKQYNSMDCGMFVIEYTRHYIESLKRDEFNVDFTQLNADDVKKQRKVWGSLIRSLAEE